MNHTPSLFRTSLLQVALLIGLGLSQDPAAAVTFSDTPAAVSNTYAGPITLQINNGLTNGESVVVQEFFDLNTNGVVDASDWLVQQFKLTDGGASMIGGIVNSNVPGDTTPTNGAITAQMAFNNGNPVQTFAGQRLLKLSSPTGNFIPITNSLTITNLPYAQGFTGNVVSGGTNVPNAAVLLFQGPAFESTVQAAVIADNSGSYSIKAPPGTYSLAATRNNYVFNVGTAPMVTLGGTTITTNLSLVPATTTLQGTIVDAANPNRVGAGILVTATSDSGLMAISFTDTNGVFNTGVTSGQWKVGADDLSLIGSGYVGLGHRTQVSAGQTGITLAVPRATGLFYGSVKDGLGNPLAGIDVYAYDNYNQYQTDGYTDANGNYCAGVVGGLNGDPWHLEISGDSNPANYVYSQASFEQAGGINLTVGQAVRQDFVALPATNWISGYLKDGSGNPIGNIWIWVQATINGRSYQGGADTDGAGHYAISVCNGSWTVGVSCGGGDNSLGSQYLCPASQTVVIANNNGTADFTAVLPTSQINGYVKDNNNNPIANVGVYARVSSSGPYDVYVTTDGSGYYSFNLGSGTWYVGLECCGNNGLSTLGYVCVGDKTTSVNDSTSGVNFSVLHAPYQITGYLRDAGNNPIANVNVWASNGSANACAITDGSGFYTLHVENGDWNVTLDCGTLGTLGYLCPGGQLVSVSGANAVADFTAPSSSAADVESYFVMKLAGFLQIDAVNLVPDTNHGAFSASLDIIQSGLDRVPVANVYLPGGQVRGLPLGSSGIELQTQESFASQAALDAVYANGNYTFAMATRDDGFQSPALTLPAAAYPAAPRVSNFAAAQAINPANPFTLQWSTPPDATTNDMLWVFVLNGTGDMVFSTPYPPTNYSNCLKGTATSVVVPADTFQPGGAYTGVIGFFRVTSLDTTAYPGALGMTLVGVNTGFPMSTPSSVPGLSQPARISATQFGFTLSGASGQTYTVLASTNAALRLSDWSTVTTTNLTGSSAFIQDNQATSQRRFYRVRVGP